MQRPCIGGVHQGAEKSEGRTYQTKIETDRFDKRARQAGDQRSIRTARTAPNAIIFLQIFDGEGCEWSQRVELMDLVSCGFKDNYAADTVLRFWTGFEG